jgi:hypothetical protein
MSVSILFVIAHAPVALSMDRQPHTQKIGHSPPHSALGGRTPLEAHAGDKGIGLVA